MAYSGQDNLSSTWKESSNNVYEYCCDLCEGEGKHKEAVGYCSNCHEYLCEECFHHHTRPEPSRHHVLLDKHQMPKDKHVPFSIVKITDPSFDKSSPQVIGVRNMTDIRIGSIDQEITPSITGCVVLPGDKLVLVDFFERVMLVNLTQGDVVSQLKLPGWIWDITQVSSTQVAVTSYNEQTIYFVNVEDKLELDRKIEVKGYCRGIASINDNIVVSYVMPSKVEIISMNGEVLQTVVTEDKGRELFTSPSYIAVSNDQQTIYISDWLGHTVTSVDLAGRVKTKYKDDTLECPGGLTVDTAGTVYVCCRTSCEAILMISSFSQGAQSVCYCEATKRLYIGKKSCGAIQVFQFI